MGNNRYNIYVGSVVELAKQLVIKSIDTALLQNDYLKMMLGSDAVDPVMESTWIYYMNLAGLYHPANIEMTVISSDTLETIVFNKENLRLHRATARDYAYGTRAYEELVSRYSAVNTPLKMSQELLIRGILSSVDLQTAIDADDGAVLWYPPLLVEPNEYSLISKIETWVKAYKLRWENPQFAISDNLYLTTSYGVMYLNLVLAILNFRLEACKTNEAHSYHVREYLASHSRLDVYWEYLTLDQAHYLYRNIRYIQRNAGCCAMFDLLVEKFLTARYIPLCEYSVRQITTGMPDSIVPEVMLRRTPLNITEISSSADLVTMEEVYAKERHIARDNSLYEGEYLSDAKEAFSISTTNNVPTKVLESKVVDYSGGAIYKLPDLLVSEWLHQSRIGVYKAVVSCTNAMTGDKYVLRAGEAFIFLTYLFYRSMGIVPDTIPPLSSARVPRDRLVSVDDMLSVVSGKWRDYLRPTLERARALLPVYVPAISVDAFHSQTHLIYKAVNEQRNIVAAEQHMEIRAQLFNAIDVLYMDRVYAPEDPPVSYDLWLKDRNIYIDELTPSQCGEMYIELLHNGTGLSVNTATSIRDVQKAMIGILTTLSSYSIQFITECNQATITPIEFPGIRTGDEYTSGSARYNVKIPLPDVIDKRVSASSVIQIDPGQVLKLETHARAKDHGSIDIAVNVKKVSRPKVTIGVNVGVNAYTTLPDVANEDRMRNALGMDGFLKLSQDERFEFKDFWASQIVI